MGLFIRANHAGSVQFSVPFKDVAIGALGILILPILVFFFGWLRWYYALPFSAVLLFDAFWVVKHDYWENSDRIEIPLLQWMKDEGTLRYLRMDGSRKKLTDVYRFIDIFQIARVFFIYGSDSGAVHGCHANRRSEFVLLNVSGSSTVRVTDGKAEQVFVLDKPNIGVYLPRMAQKEMYAFSENSILLCLASEPYDPDKYIRDYKKYVKEMTHNESAVNDCAGLLQQG